MKKESIVYVNFAPYENSGNILDYFREKRQIQQIENLQGKKADRNKESI
jgi:hypothetical protein